MFSLDGLAKTSLFDYCNNPLSTTAKVTSSLSSNPDFDPDHHHHHSEFNHLSRSQFRFLFLYVLRTTHSRCQQRQTSNSICIHPYHNNVDKLLMCEVLAFLA